MPLPEAGPERKASPDEEALVSRAKAGDADAFADLYLRYLRPVFRYFLYRVGQVQDAEDLTELVFLKAWQSMSSYNSRGVPFSAWVFTIAHNVAIDHYRAGHPAEPLDETMEIEDEAAGPEDVVQRKLEAQELARALARLSPLEQSVVALRFVDGLDHRTVATIIDKSETATRSILSRALDRLARILSPRWGHER